MSLDPSTVQSLLLGFAFAGLLANGFELFTDRRASFRLCRPAVRARWPASRSWVFAAPFIILRGTVLRRRFERRSVGAVVAATIAAGLWSLISGRVVLDVTQRLAGA